MTGARMLAQLYESWRGLSERELSAIDADAWENLAEVQHAKADLKPRIIEATDRWRKERETSVGSERGSFGEDYFRQTVNELIGLEKRNSEKLASRMEAVRQAMAEADQSVRNLNRVQQSYGGSRRSGWSSYS